MMAGPMTPSLHDLVLWRGRKWLIVRVMRLGRVEISAVKDPTVRWVCLEEQLHWEGKSCAGVLLAMPGSTETE